MLPLIHTSALHFSQPVQSYWEASADPLEPSLLPLQGTQQADVAIIGGGFTGLSAALELARQGVDVRLVEAGHIGWGASGRNGGFACIGSHKLSYSKMIKTYGLEATRSFYRTMRSSVDLVAENLQRQGIDAWKHGEGEVTLAHLPNRLEEFREDQAFLKKTFGDEVEVLTPAMLREQGLSGPNFFGGLRGNCGFGIHPLNYVRGLARAAHKTGAKLHTHSRVMHWEQQSNTHVLRTDAGELRAKRVLVATNGYTPEDLSIFHAGRIMPALSSIIVTRPLTENEKRGAGWWSCTMAYDSRNLLHYFRLLPNNRFLFGGRGGTDSSAEAEAGYRAHLTNTFHQLFPAWRNVGITHFWRGHVCLAYDLVPYVGPLGESKTVWTALAYHGNGVAMGTWSGRAVARLMTNKATHDEVPPVITRRLAKFPLPMFRPQYLKGAYVWYGWKDSR